MIMKPLPIPEIEQMNAMLDGSAFNLACDYVEAPSRYDLKKYLTITRQILVDFLASNPEKAEAYFQKHRHSSGTHDVERIWDEGREYLVASMDHGHPRSIRHFRSLPEAVAEHLLVSYGMY